MALKSCIKKVIAARGPEPKNFIPKESVPEGAEMVTASGNYEIKHMKDGTFVVETSRLVRLVNGPIIESGNVFKTKKEAEKFAREHWKSQGLDVDDRQYMLDLIDQGRPDFEILNRLEQKIIKEKDEIDWPTPKKGSVKKSEGSNPRLDRTEDSAKPKSDRTPSDGAPLKWETGKDRVTSGNYIIHETFDASIKAKPFVLNRTSPFKPIGLYKSLAEAKKAALEHYNSNVTGPDLKLGSLGAIQNLGDWVTENNLEQEHLDAIGDAVQHLSKKSNRGGFSDHNGTLVARILVEENPTEFMLKIASAMSIDRELKEEILASLKDDDIDVSAFQRGLYEVQKAQKMTTKEKIYDKYTEVLDTPRPVPPNSIFAPQTPEEKAAQVKKDSRVIANLLRKAVPESPMLAHFINKTRVLTSEVFKLSESELENTDLAELFEGLFSRGSDMYSPLFDTIHISGKGLPEFPIPEGVAPEFRDLDLDNKEDLKEQVLVIEHELTHAYTVPYIEKVLLNREGTKEELANIDYLDRSITKIQSLYKDGKLGSLSPRAFARVEYFLDQPSLGLAMAEFVSIMTAETDVSNEIYAAVSGSIPEKNLRARIAAVIAAIRESFLALTSKQLSSEIDADALQQAILNTFIMGKNMREQRADEYTMYRLKAYDSIMKAQKRAYQELLIADIEKRKGKAEADKARKAFREEELIDELRKTDPVAAEKLQRELEAQFGILRVNSPFIKGGLNKPSKRASRTSSRASFDYLNYTVATMINSKIERKGKTILGNLHNILSDKFPMYTDAANKLLGLYDGSPALQQFIHTVTGENVDKVKKADILAKFAAVNAQRTETTNDQIGKLTALSMKLSDSEHTDLDVFTSQMPLHDYFVANEAGDLSTAEKIEAKAELLRKELSRINNRAVREVDSLIDWNIGIWNKDTGKLEQKQTGNLYNLSTKYPPGEEYPTADFQVKLRQLLALESINRYGAKKFENLMKNQELFEVIKDNSMANVLSTLDNAGTGNVRDSLVMDYYKEPVEIKAIHKRDFRMYEYGENTGWKILEAPTNTKLGIVYKPTIDSTDIAGAYTDMKLISTDINVRQEFKNFPGVVESVNGHKLLLTKDQKRKMGLIEDFTQGLVRSTAHSMALQESQIIRDELLKKETHMIIGKGNSITKLETIIKAENVDNPWFLKLEEGTEYSKLSPEIRAKYMPVEGRASDVKGFNENVDLVRKDISHWLLGGTTKSLFENPTMKWALRILKNTISGSKIGMVVLNPIKIANDNLFNIMYLGVLGVSPFFIASNYKEISKDFAQYSDLQRQIFQAKLQHVARPESDKIKKHLSNLQKRLAANSIGDIGDKGFVNSLGSDLVSRSADTLSGFQADMHKALEYLLLNKNGNKNVVSHFIVQMQKIGYQAEDFFSYLGNIASQSKSTALLHQELDLVSARLREIKSEDDIVNYVAQFTTSPSSEAVRFGSAMTDLTDVLAKETLYRHLTQNKGMSPSDARIEVLDSFPDYKENMPIAIKGLSDVGIIMFPTFWLRIQKSIYHIIHDKPVSLATELMAQELLGTNVNTIFEANIINKSQQFGGILHSPFEHAGVGSVIPTHLW